ncbi:MAG: nucleoside deaminase [Acidobacteriota bacterium]
MRSNEHFMQMAIETTKQGIAAGQTPFGAVIVSRRKVVGAAHNTVWRDSDPTAHAEVNAIRLAASLLATIDLAGCTMFTTCEPCPMCLSAVHWSKIDRVVYGASIEDAARAGFSELRVGAAELARMGGSELVVEPGPLREECRALFDLWKSHNASGAY